MSAELRVWTMWSNIQGHQGSKGHKPKQFLCTQYSLNFSKRKVQNLCLELKTFTLSLVQVYRKCQQQYHNSTDQYKCMDIFSLCPANAQRCGNVVTTLSLVRSNLTLLQCCYSIDDKCISRRCRNVAKIFGATFWDQHCLNIVPKWVINTGEWHWYNIRINNGTELGTNVGTILGTIIAPNSGPQRWAAMLPHHSLNAAWMLSQHWLLTEEISWKFIILST